MAKVQRRKPKKRPAGKPRIDDELAELATVLDEQRLDNSVAAWFSIPWRDGWNAAWLARRAWTELVVAKEYSRALYIESIIHERGSGYGADYDLYEGIDNWCQELPRSVGYDLLRAAGRCVQVIIARSDGGGHTFNEILRPKFEALVEPERVAVHVQGARRADVLGHISIPRLAGAFDIAWSRGLYQAAYALQPVKS